MSVNFCIPGRDDDLLETSDTYYYVSELVTDLKEIDRAQHKFKAYVSRGEFEKLPEYFDAFFSVARHNDDIADEQRIRVFEALCEGLHNFKGTLRAHVCEAMSATAPDEEMVELNARYANCLLMYFYLLSRIAYHLESHVVKSSKSLPTSKGGKKAAAESNADYVVSFWNSCGGRLNLFRIIYGIVTIVAVPPAGGATVHAGIKFLWTPNVIDGQLISCIIKTIMKVLENPEAGKASGKNILLAAFHTIRALCVGWDQSRVVAKHLMELAPRLECFTQQNSITHFPFVDVIQLVQTKDELEPLLSAMVAYVGNFDMDSLVAKGEMSARVFSVFISSLSDRFPRLLFNNIAHIVPFLSFDPPSLRNSVLTAFTEIVLKCFDEATNADNFQLNNLQKQKRTMLFRLQDHITDISALVRTKALNLWMKLAQKLAIPLDNFRLLLVHIVGDRLADNSIMVRKAAAVLLTTMLSNNIFSPNLNLEHNLRELNELRKKQAELNDKNPEMDVIRKLNEKFDDIEASVQEIFKMALEEFVLSDNLPTTETVERDISIRRHSELLSNGSNMAAPSQDVDELPAATSRMSLATQARTQEVLDSFNIAMLVMESETRIGGCLEYLRMTMNRSPDLFPRDMDVDEVAAKMSAKARELLLQQGVANRIRDDDQVLLDEDRIEQFDRQMKEMDRIIEKTLDKLLFMVEMEKCMPKATYCIKFGQPTELSEMIRFICECCKFKIRGAQSELKKIFHLIWRKDTAVIDLIVEAGHDALFSNNKNVDVASTCTAANLMAVMSDATEEERVSLEETLMKIFTAHELSDTIVDIFWRIAEREPLLERRLVAIRLLSIVARAQKGRIQLEFSRLSRLYRTDVELVRIEVLRVIVALATTENRIDVFKQASFRIPASDRLIKAMFAFLISDLHSEQRVLWVPHCREAVNVIYGITCRPYSIISSLFSRMVFSEMRAIRQYNLILAEIAKTTARYDGLRNDNWLQGETENNVFATQPNVTSTTGELTNGVSQVIPATAQGDPDVEQRMIRMRLKYLHRIAGRLRPRWELGAYRLLYFVGEVALKFLTYLEVIFTKEIKTSLQAIHEVRLMDAEQRAMLKLIDFDFEVDTPLIQFETDCIRQRGFFEKADREDERIGLTAISEEEKLQLKLQKILDRDTFSCSTINGRILPFVVLVLKSHEFISEQLKEAAVTCLAKLMLVNRKCCGKFLPLFFNFYEGASTRLRNNMIIMMTDLCFRFPNVFNHYNDEYIRKIRDENSGIRYTCLLVLSHMLLNDLIKVTSRIADLVPCLCDDDKNVSMLARGFFTEMSKKNNILYNTMPDIISKLTTNRDLPMKKFEEVISFLFQFITKEQHREALIEKICQRFQLLQTHHVAGSSLPEALAYCITQIPLSERSFRKLVDGLRFYQELLRIPPVFKHFASTAAAFRKASAKSPELRAQVEEFERNLKNKQSKED